MVEPCRNLDLPLKAFRRQCRADRRAKELYRDVSTMSNIASQQHHGHAAATYFGGQLVSTRHRFPKRHPFFINAHGGGHAKQVVIVRPIPERLYNNNGRAEAVERNARQNSQAATKSSRRHCSERGVICPSAIHSQTLQFFEQLNIGGILQTTGALGRDQIGNRNRWHRHPIDREYGEITLGVRPSEIPGARQNVDIRRIADHRDAA